MVIYDNPKILHQGIDFLTIDYFAKDLDVYNAKFIPILERLEILKERAKSQETFGIKFIKDNLGLKMGNFFISSKGLHRFAYYIENQDYRIFISRAKINSDLPQIRVEVPAKTIFAIGATNAIKTIEIFIEKLIGSNYIRRVNRIDLATDVYGIQYTPLDIYRFQTRMGQSNYMTEYSISSYVRYNRIQGIQFGKGDKLFRIYDKSHKIRVSPNEAYIIEKWKINGYDENDVKPVFRHEIQYRRDELKKFIPIDCKDEVDYIISNIPNLWARALTYVEFVNLTDNELERITKPLIKADTKRKIFYRAKKDEKRFHLWQFINIWDRKLARPIEKIRRVKDYAFDLVKKQFKGFISSFYKVYGVNLNKLRYFVDEVESDLYKKEQITLHQYGLSKLADSFVKDYEAILLTGEFISKNLVDNVLSAYDEFINSLKVINNPKYSNPIEKAVSYV